jgi:hypothetical protein
VSSKRTMAMAMDSWAEGEPLRLVRMTLSTTG